MNLAEYEAFLKTKIPVAQFDGFEDVTENDVNPILKPHQRDIVLWAVKGGRRAIFAAFGLGKSVMQIETLRIILEQISPERYGHERALIVAPLGVRQEFIRDAAMLGVPVRFIRRSDELNESDGAPGLFITNYESVRDGKLDPDLFDAVSLDEASVLRSFGSKTYQTFLTLFDDVRYRFVCTATPSPNKFKELIHYAGFLGVMDTGQALTRFFQRNSEKANDLTLYPHKEREFWAWMGSWAVFLQRPSDLGHDDTGYDLPPLNVHYHEIATNHEGAKVERNGQARLFKDAALGLPQAAQEKRESLPARIEKLRELIAASPNDHFIIWHDLEKERRAIAEAFPDAVSVYGTQDMDEREKAIMDFSDGKFRLLSTKPEIAGSGCNFQRHCHKAIFFGIGYKFNDWIQSVHRIYRFLQTEACEVHLIYTEAERDILRTLLAKWEQHKEMTATMTEIIREHGLNRSTMQDMLARSIGVERIEVSGDWFKIANNDCVAEAGRMAENSVGLIVTSIPFANHYEYTPSYNDFGHTENNDRFWAQMDFLTPELKRILAPGRLYCCHVKDRILFGNTTGEGVPTVSPFHAEALFHGMKHGFQYLGMITVVTDVVRENNQTYRLGWSENAKDGTKMGVGSPEYVLLFRKAQTDKSKAYADTPVNKDKASYKRAHWQVDAHAFWRSGGNRLLTADELSGMGPDKLARAFTEYSLQNVYDYDFHVRIGEELEARGALPATFMSLAPGSYVSEVWTDVNRMLTLNGTQSQKGLAMHVCPLQFDIVDRLITRYSNEGDLVYDPFAGLMTVPFRAVKLGRRGGGSELNTSYFMDGVHYLKAAEEERRMPDLFALLDDDDREERERKEKEAKAEKRRALDLATARRNEQREAIADMIAEEEQEEQEEPDELEKRACGNCDALLIAPKQNVSVQNSVSSKRPPMGACTTKNTPAIVDNTPDIAPNKTVVVQKPVSSRRPDPRPECPPAAAEHAKRSLDATMDAASELSAAQAACYHQLKIAGYSDLVRTETGAYDFRAANRVCNALLGRVASDRPSPTAAEWRETTEIVRIANESGFAEIDTLEALRPKESVHGA